MSKRPPNGYYNMQCAWCNEYFHKDYKNRQVIDGRSFHKICYDEYLLHKEHYGEEFK